MRGYSEIMACKKAVELNGNGEKVYAEPATTVHHLWEPKAVSGTNEPAWHLRVSVLKDQEVQGDCPSRRFTFKSMHHLTHAANQLEAAFSDSFDIRKCGVTEPDAMGGRLSNGRSENITIEFESDNSKKPWREFLANLKTLEDEWEHESSHML